MALRRRRPLRKDMSVEQASLDVDALCSRARAVFPLSLTHSRHTHLTLLQRRDCVRQVAACVLAELQSTRVAQQEAPRCGETPPLRGVGGSAVRAHPRLRLVVVQHVLLLTTLHSTCQLRRRLRPVLEGVAGDVRVREIAQTIAQTHLRVLAQWRRCAGVREGGRLDGVRVMRGGFGVGRQQWGSTATIQALFGFWM